MKLDDLSKWALALNAPNGGQDQPAGKDKKKKQYLELADKFKKPLRPNVSRDYASELSAIRSVEELKIDHRRALNIKRGDLAIIQGEVFRCQPKAVHLQDIPLVLKRLDCVDRRTYDLKLYEADTFSRFQGHPNITSLYSYWSEKPTSPYTYKNLVLLMEEGILGDMYRIIVLNKRRPTNRLALRYICDMAKGLIAIHNCNIIHARVKPSAVYLDGKNTAMLGEFGKVELDSARQTHQLFSKLLIGEAIPHTLVYWAPEVLKLDKYGKGIDMWALGVTIYQMVTGQHPFNVVDEHLFRDDVLSANVDLSPLEGYPRIAMIVRSLLRVVPEERWTASQVLAYAQYDFAVDIQRIWRGHVTYKWFQQKRAATVLVQANIKGYIRRLIFHQEYFDRRNNAAIKIQRNFRMHVAYQTFRRQKAALMKCQANVLTRQNRRSYLKFREHVIACQSLNRRFLTRRWFAKVAEHRAALEKQLETIQNLILRYNEEAQEFKGFFEDEKLSEPLQYLASFEDYELSRPDEYGQICLPKLRSAFSRISDLQDQCIDYQRRLKGHEDQQVEQSEDELQLQAELGVKYDEYKPMVEALKKSLKRVADQCARASFLAIKIQHPYVYSKWDQVHEPHNVVENVLKDDDAVFRTLSPVVDLTLANGAVCFVSEVHVFPGDCGPANVEIYTSNIPDKWNLISTHKCTRDTAQSFMLPGEQLCKYMRLKMPNNIRGGNIVSIRRVQVKGLIKE